MLRRTRVLALLAVACVLPAPAQPVPEHELRSAVVYNVAKLTEWPASAFDGPEAPVLLCLLGTDDSAPNPFASIEGKRVQGRTLHVRREDRPSRLAHCQILFLEEEDEPRLAATLQALRGQPVLTLGAFAGFAEAGGMLGMFLEDDQMRVKINNGAALRSQLHISAQLLRMGELVKGPAP